jgi:hypothetical protein
VVRTIAKSRSMVPTMLKNHTAGLARVEPRNTIGIVTRAIMPVNKSPNAAGNANSAANPGYMAPRVKTSFPNAASSAEAELARGSVAAEREESAAANTIAPRHRRSPCWRRDLMSGRGQRWRTCRYSCKSLPARLSTRKSNRRLNAITAPVRSFNPPTSDF